MHRCTDTYSMHVRMCVCHRACHFQKMQVGCRSKLCGDTDGKTNKCSYFDALGGVCPPLGGQYAVARADGQLFGDVTSHIPTCAGAPVRSTLTTAGTTTATTKFVPKDKGDGTVMIAAASAGVSQQTPAGIAYHSSVPPNVLCTVCGLPAMPHGVVPWSTSIKRCTDYPMWDSPCFLVLSSRVFLAKHGLSHMGRGVMVLR